MSTHDAGWDVWEWMRPPLEDLKHGYLADPGKPWQERRQAFLDQLGLREACDNPVVEQLLERLDETPEDERDAIIGSDSLDAMAYHFVEEYQAGQQAARHEGAGYEGTGYEGAGYEGTGYEAVGYDEQAWHAYLAENGPHWDGTEASWEQFRQWFGYYADQRGLAVPAAAFLDYLTGQSAGQRVSTFAEHGVTITPPNGEAGQQQHSAPAFDENYGMWYRYNPADATYQWAVGDRSSEPDGSAAWMTQSEAEQLWRDARPLPAQAPVQPPSEDPEVLAAAQAVHNDIITPAVSDVLSKLPQDLLARIGADEAKRLVEELVLAETSRALADMPAGTER